MEGLFESCVDVTLVALGRQALGLVAARLRDNGCDGVIVPVHACQTMVTPWELEGFRVRRVGFDSDLLMDPGALEQTLTACEEAGERTVVMVCETYGICPSPGLRRVLEWAEGRGMPVVVDRTHSFLADVDASAVSGSRSWRGGIEVVSTRKLLPLPEIAWVRGIDAVPGDRRPTDDALTTARREFLERPGVATFEAVEDLADELWRPVRPHPLAIEAWRDFDLAGFVGRVRRTRDLLEDALSGVDVVNPGASCPLVVRLPDADRTADELFRRGHVGPIHWDRPQHLAAPWPSGLLCLPTVLDDHGVEEVLAAVEATA